MANFTNEARVRERFQLTDTTLASTDLVTGSIDDAHTELLRYLEPVFATETPEEALVMGETLLAGAHVHQSLASKAAAELKTVSIAGQRLEATGRVEALLGIARSAEEQAWCLFEPYLAARTGQAACMVTDSAPVLGEG